MLASFVNRRGLPRRSNSPPTSPTPTAFASSAICSERRTPSASRNRLKSSGGTKKCADPSKNLAGGAISSFGKDSDDIFQEPRTIFQKTIGSWFLVLGSWFLVLGSWFLVLGSWFLVLGSWFLVLGSWFLEFMHDLFRIDR